ncbi:MULTISPECIES: hypothetical protein [unclassified Mesorhizobium]|uniref:hypothetical protein n=1 Tax=unclassified Mesorhizobium TaxID=325217 RepID=UPI00112AEAC1|nr:MULTISPECIES: hypothetical protein [unclassified Mesorhizobium]TPL05235.1 hypothetical protein FJ567_02680 [Mesorhizobium sp. B2-4-16]TPL74609.1 hypothetical protein FJ956_08165 [Mesorhizobium sp. B2-4-3]
MVDRKNHARYQARECIALASNANPISLPAMRGRNVLITISFNDAEVIDWQTKLVAKNVPGAIHVIADNSSNLSARTAIRDICASAGLAYIPLPANPWVGRRADGSKSHGFALNWVWANVVLANSPSMVGFLDHDIFPTEKADPFRLLELATVAGAVRTAPGGRWYLWPGFAFFHLGKLPTDRLNFGKDWLDGFDTGGLNWGRLYQYLNDVDVCAASHEQLPIANDVTIDDALFERIDNWLHESRYSTTIHMESARRQYLLGLKRSGTLETLRNLTV